MKIYKYRPMYKKVARAMFTVHVMTIDKEHEADICAGTTIKNGASVGRKIMWEGKEYDARIGHSKGYYQLDWGRDKNLVNKFNKTFVQSYAISTTPPKYHRGLSRHNPQEVLSVRPLDNKRIEFGTFIKIENDWNQLLRKLVEENVFGWVFQKEGKAGAGRNIKERTLITKSSRWHDIKEFDHHANRVNVIYYLFHTKKGLLYIGKALHLGLRLGKDIGKKHQGMPAGWDKFKYDIVKPQYDGLLDLIEDHTIRAFASVLRNYKNYPTIASDEVKKKCILVNSQWKKIL